MALLLETDLGDLVIDMDTLGSPHLCKNVLKLAKARYYTSTLIHSVQPNKLCMFGDARGDGSGGCSIYGLIDSLSRYHDTQHIFQSEKRFIKSIGKVLTKEELQEKGRVFMTNLRGVKDTIGSQFMIALGPDVIDDMHDDNYHNEHLSLGMVSEDDDSVLDKIKALYCDGDGRPYADIRIIRAHILHDPFEDPDGMDELLEYQDIKLLDPADLPKNHSECSRWLASSSPSLTRPKEEVVELRISFQDAQKDIDYELERKRAELAAKKDDRSRAVMLEMLGDLPSADMKPPENVLFVCKLNPVTDDDDLQLIFSRFDPNCKAEVIRDSDTGDSLQYAFIEFDTEEACNQAYFKMNNALVDDRRIKVDFSQSVSKEWHKFQQKKRDHSVKYTKQSNTDFYRGSSNLSTSNAKNQELYPIGKEIRGVSSNNRYSDLNHKFDEGKSDYRRRRSDKSKSRDRRRSRERSRSRYRRRSRERSRSRDKRRSRERSRSRSYDSRERSYRDSHNQSREKRGLKGSDRSRSYDRDKHGKEKERHRRHRGNSYDRHRHRESRRRSRSND